MLWNPLGQRYEIADIKGEYTAPLSRCAEQLFVVARIDGYPLVWGACNVVSALKQFPVERYFGSIGI